MTRGETDRDEAKARRDEALKDGGAYGFAIARPVAVTMIVLAVATFGYISFRKIPLELLPPISYPSVTVRTEYLGAGPEDIEERISKRIEEALAVLPGLVGHSSTSRPGVSDVLLEFQWGKSLSLATQEIRERLDRANLPADVKAPLVLRYDPSLDPVLRIAVYGDRDLAETRVAAEEIIGRKLQTISGVAAVKTRGGLETEIRVRLDNKKLSQLNLDISEVDRKLRIENVNLASGKLIEGDTEYLVRTLNEFKTLDEILDLGVAERGGQPIRVKDVATVERTAKERDVITRVAGRESVELQVFREADANIVDLAKAVRTSLLGSDEDRKFLAEIESGKQPDPEKLLSAELLKLEKDAPATSASPGTKDDAKSRPQEPAAVLKLRDLAERKKRAQDTIVSKLPRGIEARVLSDQSVFIENAIEEVKGAGLLGGLLSVVVLLLFLRNLGATSMLSISIPLSVIATFACMFATHTTLNIMSLGGLALGIGMLVDDSIVVLESIVRCREEGDDPTRGALRGTREVGAAVIASTLTTIAVFFPVAFVSGIAGQIFKDQALTVVFALASSIFVALFFVPVLAAQFSSMSGTAEEKKTRKHGAWNERGSIYAQPKAFLGALLGPIVRPRGLLAVRALRDRAPSTGALEKIGRVVRFPVDLLQIACEFLGRVMLGVVAAAIYAVIGLGALAIRVLALAAAPLAFLFDRTYLPLAKAYPAVLRFLLKSNLRMVALMIFATAIGVVTYGLVDELGSEMLPEVHQGELIVDVDLRVGTPVEETAAMLLPVENAISKVSGIAEVSSSCGIARDEVAGVDEGSHTAKILLKLSTGSGSIPAAERAKFEQRLIEDVRSILSQRAELTGFRFSRPTLFSIKAPLAVEARGEDLTELRAAAVDLTRQLQAIPELSDVRSTIGRGNPEILLTLDRERMLRFGLDIEAISNRIRAQVQGVVSTRFAEGDRRVDIRVKSDVMTVDDLLSLTVNRGRAVDLADTLDRGSEGGGTSTGSSKKVDRTFFPGVTVDLGATAPIPLRQVAQVKIVEGPSEIRRISGQRAAVVSASTSGFDIGSALNDIRRVLSDVEREHPTITCSTGGQGADIGGALDEMKMVTLIAIFLVYLVMAAEFESIIQPLIIMMTIPLALVGGILALYLTHTPMSVVALIGAVVLAGIVVKNAIVMLDYTNQLRARGMSVVDALVEAAGARLRPILMTTGTTVLGLVPLTGVLERIPGIQHLPVWLWAGSELQAPLAVTVIGGLLLSTLLTLVVIPALYALVETFRERLAAASTRGAEPGNVKEPREAP